MEDQEGRVPASTFNLTAKRHRDTGALSQVLLAQTEPAACQQDLIAQIRKNLDAIHQPEASQLCLRSEQ